MCVFAEPKKGDPIPFNPLCFIVDLKKSLKVGRKWFFCLFHLLHDWAVICLSLKRENHHFLWFKCSLSLKVPKCDTSGRCIPGLGTKVKCQNKSLKIEDMVVCGMWQITVTATKCITKETFLEEIQGQPDPGNGLFGIWSFVTACHVGM